MCPEQADCDAPQHRVPNVLWWQVRWIGEIERQISHGGSLRYARRLVSSQPRLDGVGRGQARGAIRTSVRKSTHPCVTIDPYAGTACVAESGSGDDADCQPVGRLRDQYVAGPFDRRRATPARVVAAVPGPAGVRSRGCPDGQPPRSVALGAGCPAAIGVLATSAGRGARAARARPRASGKAVPVPSNSCASGKRVDGVAVACRRTPRDRRRSSRADINADREC
jgi:hypothetical protein